MVRKHNNYHDQILGQIAGHGLNIAELRKKYKLPFIIKLFKYVQKATDRHYKNIDLLYPREFNWEKLAEYVEQLEEAGFKIKTWKENFIDEDTGHIVSINRYKFKPLK